jgi:hypothetical protein
MKITPTTVRLTAHDRALLDKLVELDAAEMAECGAHANISTVIRRLVRQDAKARGVVVGDVPPRRARPRPRPPKVRELRR